MEAITISLDKQAAETYAVFSDVEKQELETLFNFLVKRLSQSPVETVQFVKQLLEGDNQYFASMESFSKEGTRPIGLAEGQFTVPDNFDAILADEILELFEGE